MKNTIIFVLLVVVFFSCKQPIKEVVFDNPSKEKITVTIDDFKIINLEPEQTRKVELKYGKRMISVNNQEAEEMYLDKENEYLINPLKETYYLQRVKYFASRKEEKRYYQDHFVEESEIEGVKVNGDFEKIENKLLIKKVWEFGIGEELTSGMRSRSIPRRGYITGTRIHRKIDLLRTIQLRAKEIFDKEFQKMNKE